MEEVLYRHPDTSLESESKPGRLVGGWLALVLAISWRNLWRSKRRTWLMAGAIGFAIWLLSFGIAANYGTFNAMIRSATDLLLGHVQIQHEDYVESEQFRHRIQDATGLVRRLERHEGVRAASARAQVGALISVGESSLAGFIMGVDARRESLLSTLPSRIVQGRYLQAADEAIIGSGVARRLGLGIGDEIILLGSGAQGGVAAMAQRLVGIFETRITELDRSLVQVPLASLQSAFELGDEAHSIVMATEDVQGADALAATLNRELSASEVSSPLVARSWNQVDPQIQQMLDLKIGGLGMFFAICVLMVSFSVLNSVLMSVFERTREFGVMTALGLRKNTLFWMLQLEGLMCAVLGCLLAAASLAGIFLAIGDSGIPLPEETGAMFEEVGFGARLLIEFDLGTYLIGAGIMLAATQTAATIASVRLRGFSPIAALRAE